METESVVQVHIPECRKKQKRGEARVLAARTHISKEKSERKDG